MGPEQLNVIKKGFGFSYQNNVLNWFVSRNYINNRNWAHGGNGEVL